ncbi:MAG: hypothetical protein H6613_01965 [Ignavibacteriales bacterium]|nr:hypothetical protein [Ignavibacteriales bacterium]
MLIDFLGKNQQRKQWMFMRRPMNKIIPQIIDHMNFSLSQTYIFLNSYN